jgi:probable F420-dependent oxidoreductase
MLVDTTLGSLESAADVAQGAESEGYDGVFTGEVRSDPFLPLVLAAQATSRIDLGTSIAVAFSRSPMSLAYTAYDLQRFSKGRFILGLGSQVKAHITRRFSMPWGRPAQQMQEFVLAMRAAWQSWTTGAPLHFESEHYRHTLMTPTFAPAPHDYGAPRVLVAGVGDSMTRVAGEVADGVICHAFTTERWIREHTGPMLTEGCRRAGRSFDGFTVKAAFYLATGTDEDVEIAIKNIRTQLAFYASTPAYRPVLDLHGWGGIGIELTRLSKAGRWAEMDQLISDEMLESFALVAPIDELRDRLVQRCAGVVNRVSFISHLAPLSILEAMGTNQ